MAEVLAEYSDVVISQAGRRSIARACGAPAPSGQWQGWIEFIEMATGRALRSGRETTQPNPVDTVYWRRDSPRFIWKARSGGPCIR